MSVAGRNLSIYCYNMGTSNPLEYLTLTTGERENYAEVYGLRWEDILYITKDVYGISFYILFLWF